MYKQGDHGVIVPMLTANNQGYVDSVPAVVGSQDGAVGYRYSFANSGSQPVALSVEARLGYLINSNSSGGELYWLVLAGNNTLSSRPLKNAEPISPPYLLPGEGYPSSGFHLASVIGNVMVPENASVTLILVGQGAGSGSCLFQLSTSGQGNNGGLPLIVWQASGPLTTSSGLGVNDI